MGHGRSEVSRRVGSLRVRERIIGKSNPYPTSSRRPSLTSSGLPRMVAVAAHSRFSSPAGMRLAGKFVSNSTNGILAEERVRQTVTAPREQWEPVEVPEKEHGEGNGGGEGQEAAGAGRVSTDWPGRVGPSRLAIGATPLPLSLVPAPNYRSPSFSVIGPLSRQGALFPSERLS